MAILISMPITEAKPVRFVVAAALVRGGEVLINERPKGKSWAGYWEFPGGKCEASETPAASLIRELDEELGVRVEAGAVSPMGFACHEYEEAHVMLMLFICREWGGEPVAQEGQKLAWVEAQKLAEQKMLPADMPLIDCLLAHI